MRFPPDTVFGISTRSPSLSSFPSFSFTFFSSFSVKLSLLPSVLPQFPRPSTPVFDLLEHRYGERWLEERREAERKQRQKNNKKVLYRSLSPITISLAFLSEQKLQGVYETRASLMRRYSEPVDSPPLWKMKRWQKVRHCSLQNPQCSIYVRCFIFLSGSVF